MGEVHRVAQQRVVQAQVEEAAVFDDDADQPVAVQQADLEDEVGEAEAQTSALEAGGDEPQGRPVEVGGAVRAQAILEPGCGVDGVAEGGIGETVVGGSGGGVPIPVE